MRVISKSTGALLNSWRPLTTRAMAFLLVVILSCTGSPAYSVLTHEEIVDLLWADEIRPLLLQRFPGLTEDQVKEAHAYAYGGAVIQDLGYYPFGSAEFSQLVHYVRSGDFVRELLLESQDANEYAFALGALSHYASDIAGHPAVNQAVALDYPKLRAKFGNSVRYAQNKTAHLKNRIWIRHGAGSQEPLCFAAVSRFHWIQSIEAIAGESIPRCIRVGTEGCAHPRGSCYWVVSFFGQPAHSANDKGRPANPQKRLDP